MYMDTAMTFTLGRVNVLPSMDLGSMIFNPVRILVNDTRDQLTAYYYGAFSSIASIRLGSDNVYYVSFSKADSRKAWKARVSGLGIIRCSEAVETDLGRTSINLRF